MMMLRSFLLLLAAALFSSGVHAAPKPVRLWEIFAVRFVVADGGVQLIERGLLDSLGAFRVFEQGALAPGVTAPPEALNRVLITVHAWYAYDVLGAEALGNFVVGSPVLLVGEQGYFPVSVSENAKLDLGELVNISTRATLTPGGSPIVGGFVIEGAYRWVLIRGVGPTLAGFGVGDPLADPFITLYKHGSNQGLAFNDDWSQRFDADTIEQVAAQIGAFPLPRNSKDAAYLIELPPGAYTVHLTTTGSTGGTALIEIYAVP